MKPTRLECCQKHASIFNTSYFRFSYRRSWYFSFKFLCLPLTLPVKIAKCFQDWNMASCKRVCQFYASLRLKIHRKYTRIMIFAAWLFNWRHCWLFPDGSMTLTQWKTRVKVSLWIYSHMRAMALFVQGVEYWFFWHNVLCTLEKNIIIIKARVL